MGGTLGPSYRNRQTPMSDDALGPQQQLTVGQPYWLCICYGVMLHVNDVATCMFRIYTIYMLNLFSVPSNYGLVRCLYATRIPTYLPARATWKTCVGVYVLSVFFVCSLLRRPARAVVGGRESLTYKYLNRVIADM